MRVRPVFGLFFALTVSSLVSAQGVPQPPRPDVILVSLDTFRVDRVAAWGGPSALTPSLNALAEKGRVFENCFTPTPVTLPAHASLLTACSPERAGLVDNGQGRLATGIPTLAEAFAASGYRTAAVVSATVLDSRHGLDRGFHHYDDDLSPLQWRDASEVTERAIRALEDRSKPVFLWAHYFNTHEPYAAPEEYENRGATPYDRAVAYEDAQVGRLLAGLRPGTIVAVVSDHGECLGDHGEETHGITLYQSAVQVVCILVAPGLEKGRDGRLCSLADVAPTLASLAGLSPLKGAEGRRLDVAAPKQTRPVPLFTLLPFSTYRWRPVTGVTDGRYKWVVGKTALLFDLSADPKEAHDLSASAPEAARELRKLVPSVPKPSEARGSADASLRSLGYLNAGGGNLGALDKLPDAHDRLPFLSKMRAAQQARSAGDLARAEKLYREVVEADPGNPSALFDLAETYRRQEEHSKALPLLDKAISLAPGLVEAWLAKGHTLVSMTKVEEAAVCYRKVLELSPDAVDALNAMAGYHLDLNQPDKAFPILDHAVSSGVADQWTYNILGRIHLIQEQDEEARKDFLQARRIATEPEAVLKQQADTYLMRKRFKEASACYTEGIARFPNYAPNYLTLAAFSLEAEQPQKALELFKRALACPLSAKERTYVQGIVTDLEKILAEGPQEEGPKG